MSVDFDTRGLHGMDFFIGESINLARNGSLNFRCFLQTCSFSVLIDGLDSCRLAVGYCEVYKEYLYTTINVGP